MKDMTKTTNKYLIRRNLKLSSEKSKVLIFLKDLENKEGKWNDESIEVEECKYSERSIHQSDNRNKNSVGIEHRRFWDNFQIRTLLFDSIIKSMILCGAEVWGWREFRLIEKCQDTYFK